MNHLKISQSAAEEVQHAFSSFFKSEEFIDIVRELRLTSSTLADAVDNILAQYAPDDVIDAPECRSLLSLSEARRLLVAILSIFPD